MDPKPHDKMSTHAWLIPCPLPLTGMVNSFCLVADRRTLMRDDHLGLEDSWDAAPGDLVLTGATTLRSLQTDEIQELFLIHFKQ